MLLTYLGMIYDYFMIYLDEKYGALITYTSEDKLMIM